MRFHGVVCVVFGTDSHAVAQAGVEWHNLGSPQPPLPEYGPDSARTLSALDLQV